MCQPTAQTPRVLTHGVLLQRVWGPERVGEPWLIRDVVKRVRRKLGETAASARFICTEPRVGYPMAAREAGEAGRGLGRSLLSPLAQRLLIWDRKPPWPKGSTGRKTRRLLILSCLMNLSARYVD